MKRWKNLLKAVLFLGIFAFLLIHVSYILRPYAGSASRKNICGFYAEPEDSLDVVCVGASSVFAFWEPMKLWHDRGIASYNYATGILPPQMILPEIKEIRRHQDPQLYLIEMHPFTVGEDGYYQEQEVANMDHDVPLRNSLDNMKYSLGRLQAVLQAVPDDRDRLPYVIDLMKYHTEWTRLWDRQSLLFWRNETNDFTRGFKLVDEYRSLEVTDYSAHTQERAISQRMEEMLTELLDYCRDENLPVLFIVNAYNQTKKDKEEYNYIKRIVESYSFTFLNTNDDAKTIGLDFSRDYYDNAHTNIFGSEKYMDYMEAYLDEHYDLPDHRDDPVYERWDRDYVKWEEEVEQVKETILLNISEGKEN